MDRSWRYHFDTAVVDDVQGAVTQGTDGDGIEDDHELAR